MDPIAQMFSQMQNATAVGKKQIELPASRLKLEILKILKKEGLVENIESTTEHKKSAIKIIFSQRQRVSRIIKISKPSLKVYTRANQIKKMQRQGQMLIISTSQGIMTGREAQNKGLGGEVLGRIEL